MVGSGGVSFLLVAAGGAIGSAARYGVSLAGLHLLGPGFPWATLAVNLLGSLLIGLLAGWQVEGQARLFWVAGVLGGFTTFSAFSLETMLLWERAPWLAALYVAASVGLGLAAFALGWWLARG